MILPAWLLLVVFIYGGLCAFTLFAVVLLFVLLDIEEWRRARRIRRQPLAPVIPISQWERRRAS